MRPLFRITAALGVFGIANFAEAGETPAAAPARRLDVAALDVLDVSVTGLTSSKMDAPGSRSVRQSELVADFEYTRRFGLGGALYLAFGASYEGFFFSETAPGLPNRLQSLSGVVALQYIVQNYVAATLEVRPGFYFEESLTSHAFDAPVTAYMPIQLSPKVFAMLGARVSGFQSWPVVPIGGLVWLINDDLRLEGIFPRPRLVYSVGDQWEFILGGEITGGDFRLDRDPKAPERLQGAVVEYTEYRAGLGVNFVQNDAMTFSLDAGYVFERKLDYFRADRSYESDGSVYGRLQFSWEF